MWKDEYEKIRENVLYTIRKGNQLHEYYQVAVIYSQMKEIPFKLATCGTTYTEWILEIEKKYKEELLLFDTYFNIQ